MKTPKDIQRIIDIARRIYNDSHIQTGGCGCGCCCTSDHTEGSIVEEELRQALKEYDDNNEVDN